LISNLNQRVRFLAFTSGEADYQLQLTLSRKQLGDPPPQGPTWEVGFMAKLDGPGLPGQSIYWQRFRPEARYLDRVGTHEELEPEIQAVADEADYSGLVRGLFREIVIASSGHFKADEQSRLAGWILPYKHTEICVDSGSVIEVTANVPSAFGSVKEEYETDRFLPYQPQPSDSQVDLEGQLVCLTKEDNPGVIDRLIRLDPAQVEITEVKVADYKADDKVCKPDIPPEEVAADFLEPPAGEVQP
ncbi:MAG: hypothetical protein GY953_25800, partial [bacterium]|nr:hypothetical protein [bacterium]